MDLISVIVPVYKTEAYLEKCVTSICDQTYENLEIILVDDSSPDGCPRLCEELALVDQRITVIHQCNQGQGMARNTGLRVATGDYVMFIDSDDWISPDHIASMYRTITECEADAVIGAHTSVNAVDEQQQYPLKIEQRMYCGEEIRSEIVLELIGTETTVRSDVGLESSASMTLYSMKIIRSNNLMFASERIAVAEDLFFNIDFFTHADRVAALNEFGYFYYVNHQSTSRKYDEKRFERTCRFYELLQQRAAFSHIPTGYRIERTFLMKVRVALQLIVKSDLNRCQKMMEIQHILNHKLVKDVLQRYPIHRYPAFQRVFAYMMRCRSVIGVYILIKLRDWIRRKKF